jgi:DNA-binding LytR/AlgR family response regulator
MISCIALDDEPMALEVLKVYASKIPYIELTQSFTQVSKARNYLLNYPVDLIFLDINMPDMNGLDFYKKLKQSTSVIFTTAHSKYAVEGFNVNALDYLLKPIDFNRFEQACQKAKDFIDYQNKSNVDANDCLYVRSEYALIKIPFSDIIYLETMDDYIKIHRRSNDTVLTLMSMKKILQKLPQDQFIRVHRSFSVSVDDIESIRAKTITLKTIDIPIGRSYEKEIRQRFHRS